MATYIAHMDVHIHPFHHSCMTCNTHIYRTSTTLYAVCSGCSKAYMQGLLFDQEGKGAILAKMINYYLINVMDHRFRQIKQSVHAYIYIHSPDPDIIKGQ